MIPKWTVSFLSSAQGTGRESRGQTEKENKTLWFSPQAHASRAGDVNVTSDNYDCLPDKKVDGNWVDITLIVEWGWVEEESHTTCDHVHQRPGVCVQEMDIMRFTAYLSLC